MISRAEVLGKSVGCLNPSHSPVSRIVSDVRARRVAMQVHSDMLEHHD